MIFIVLALIAVAIFGAIASPKAIRHYRFKTALRAQAQRRKKEHEERLLTQEDVDEAFDYRPRPATIRHAPTNVKPENGTTYQPPTEPDPVVLGALVSHSYGSDSTPTPDYTDHSYNHSHDTGSTIHESSHTSDYSSGGGWDGGSGHGGHDNN